MTEKARGKKEWRWDDGMDKRTKHIFAYIGNHLFDHAFSCEERWCVCKASTFMDAICELRDHNPKYKRLVKELLERNDNKTNCEFKGACLCHYHDKTSNECCKVCGGED